MGHLTPAAARVYHGAWIADCPRPGCANAEPLTPRQPGLVCTNCRWAGPVTWPDDPDVIAGLLAARPVPQTRNWFPGETPATLAAENTEHGVT